MYLILEKIFIRKTNSTLIHFLRSIASGSISSILDIFTLIILVEFFNFNYLTGGVIGLIIGTTLNYFISIKWIFSSRSVENKKLEYIIFIFLGLIGGILNIALLWFFTDKVGFYYIVSRITAASTVFIFNFFARKIILFKTKSL